MHLFLQVPGKTDSFTPSTTLSSTSAPPSETTTTTFGVDISVTKDTNKDNSLDRWDVSTPKQPEEEVQMKEAENEILAKDGRGSRRYEIDPPEEVTSENLWERTEVLAGKDRFPLGFTASLLSSRG